MKEIAVPLWLLLWLIAGFVWYLFGFHWMALPYLLPLMIVGTLLCGLLARRNSESEATSEPEEVSESRN